MLMEGIQPDSLLCRRWKDIKQQRNHDDQQPQTQTHFFSCGESIS